MKGNHRLQGLFQEHSFLLGKEVWEQVLEILEFLSKP